MSEDQQTEPSDGNIFKPQLPEQIYSGWRERKAGRRKVTVIAAIGGIAVGTFLLARRARHQMRQHVTVAA